MRAKSAIFGVVFPVTIVLDLITKRWALDALAGGRRLDLLRGMRPCEYPDCLLALTLAFNRGAAFGIRIGDDSRWFFVPITVIALVLLGILLVQARKDDMLRAVSLSLVLSGAVGNLWDRVRWSRGVVDFIGPVNLGFTNFPIFNVADIAITCGAALLAISFWLEEREERRAGVAATETAPPPS